MDIITQSILRCWCLNYFINIKCCESIRRCLLQLNVAYRPTVWNTVQCSHKYYYDLGWKKKKEFCIVFQENRRRIVWLIEYLLFFRIGNHNNPFLIRISLCFSNGFMKRVHCIMFQPFATYRRIKTYPIAVSVYVKRC